MAPDFIIADEPISDLDVSIRVQVLNLLPKLEKKQKLTYLFVAHDLSVVCFICDRIAVIHRGKIVDLAVSEELFAHPLHPYTRAMLSATPQLDPISERQKKLLVCDPACHDCSETNKPGWHEIVPAPYVSGGLGGAVYDLLAPPRKLLAATVKNSIRHKQRRLLDGAVAEGRET